MLLFPERMTPCATGTTLTKDLVSQLYSLITYLFKPEHLKTEGLFRKTGNVTRQRLLKEWVLQGSELNLNDATFSPHDVATVLKQFLSDLTEPLLSKKHYEAHIQIVGKYRKIKTKVIYFIKSNINNNELLI